MATEKKRKLMTETEMLTSQETQQRDQSVFLLSKPFCGSINKIRHLRWQFLIDKLSENEEHVDYNNLNVTKLFKLYSNTTLCQWIPNNLLLLNVFRYLSGNPLILIKLKETSGLR